MAKLNITFVNEVGNNLNRYKAIDVNTGEEYLFDLSRNGTITTPGTPLNAEIMNEIVSAINEHFSNLVVEINDTTPSDIKYPSEKAVVDYVGQIANEESVDVSDNVLIKISGVSDNLAIPPESQMEVNSIEGNSVVVNQLVPIISTISNNGVTLTNNGDGTYTLNGTATDAVYFYFNNIQNILGHKIFIGFANLDTAVEGLVLLDGNSGAGLTETKNLFNWTYSNNFICDIRVSNGTTLNNVVVRPFFIDLTQWFGSNDNIPQDILNTPSNFFKHYKGSLAYDTGHIENGSGNLVDTNRNIWDEEWELGYWDNATGAPGIFNSEIRSKNPIKVFANTEYYFYGAKDGSAINYYDINGNHINYKWFVSSSIFTTPNNCSLIKINLGGNYGTTYKHDICINKSDTKFNGTYVKHIKNTLNFGNDTLRSAGKARDKKIPDGEITRKVGRVDLGTLTWDYNSTYNIAEAVISDMKQPASYDDRQEGIICSKYSISSVVSLDNNMDDKSILRNVGKIYIRDTSYTDVATFKAAMSGVILYYELETPTIEQGTPYDNHIPVYYGGQEYLTGDVPFVINKNYDISIKDQVLTNVKVDKEQSEQIHALESVNREQSNAINSLQNEVSNKVDKVVGKGLSTNDYTNEEKERISNLENSQFDSSKLKIEQNLVNTILKYNNVEIDRIENLDVAYLPNIVFDVYQDSQFTAQEKVTITNSTDIDMYVSIKGLKEHNNLYVPFGESVTSQLTASIESSLPNSYIAAIEIKIYYNPKTNYNATTGYTVFENVKTINLRATVHPTDR